MESLTKLVVRRAPHYRRWLALPSLWPLTLSLAILFSVLMLSNTLGVSPEALIDGRTGSRGQTDWYDGLLAKLSTIVLGMSAAILLFAVYLRRQDERFYCRSSASFWFASYTMFLLLHDLFPAPMTTDSVVLDVIRACFQVALGLLALLLLWLFRGVVGRSRRYALTAAMCWGISVSVDLLIDSGISNGIALLQLEEGAKLLGIFFWGQFCVELSSRSIREPAHIGRRTRPPLGDHYE